MRQPTTLEEARQARLRTERRRDGVHRAFTLFGMVVAGAFFFVVATVVSGHVVRLGKGDLAAGNPSQVVTIPWSDAPEVFRGRLVGGPFVEARLVALGIGVPSGAEFRVNGVPAGAVFGSQGEAFALPRTRLSLEGRHGITIHLDPGYVAPRTSVVTGVWIVTYRSDP